MRKDAQAYSAFCRARSLRPWPPTVNTLGAFAHHRAGSVSGQTVLIELGRLQLFCARAQQQWPPHQFLNPVLEGIAREFSTPTSRPTPIRLVMILDALRKLPTLESAVATALKPALMMMLLSHNALLRTSELRALTWANIELAVPPRPSTLTVPPHADKTNKRGDVRRLALPAAHASPLVSFLFTLRSTTAPAPSDFVCQYRTAQKWNAQIKRVARTFSWPGRFTSHSLRAGGATDLLEGGATPETVRSQGRWASNAFLSYWRPCPAESAGRVTAAFQRAGLGVRAPRAAGLSLLPRSVRRSMKTAGQQ